MPPAEAEGLRLHRPGVSLVEGDEVIALVGANVDEVQLLTMLSMRQASDFLMPLLARAMGVAGDVQGAGGVAAGVHCGHLPRGGARSSDANHAIVPRDRFPRMCTSRGGRGRALGNFG